MFRHLLKPKIDSPAAPDFYQYHEGDIITGGAERFAPTPKHTNPAVLFIGPGTHCGTFLPIPPPPSEALIAVPTTGLGGTVAGQFAMYPLQPLDSVYGH